GRVGEVARKVLEQREAKTLPRILRLRQRNARNSGAGKGLVGNIDLDLPASNGIREAVSRVASGLVVPSFDDPPGSDIELLPPFGLNLFETIHKHVSILGIPFLNLLESSARLDPLPGDLHLLFRPIPIAPSRFRKLSEIPLPTWWDNRQLPRIHI